MDSKNKLKIKEIAEVITGGTPSTSNTIYWENGDIPWIRSGELKNCKIYDSELKITKKGLDNSSTRLLPIKTVLIALTGATTGQVGLLEFEACANQSVTGILPSKKHIPEYLFYYLRSQRSNVLKKSYGGAQKHISQEFVKNIIVPLPPLETQKQIVSQLEKLEKLKEKREQNIQECDELIKSIFYDMFGDPVKNEKKWVVKKLEDVAEVKGRVGWKGYKKTDLRDSGPLVLGVTNITDNGYIDLSNPTYISIEKFEESPEIKTKLLDIIFTQRGTLGKIGIINKKIGDATINPCVLIIRPKNIDPIYLNNLLNNAKVKAKFKSKLGSTVIPMITQRDVNKLSIVYPDPELQSEFAKKIRCAEKLKEKQINSKEEIDNLFNGLMQKYFKGD